MKFIHTADTHLGFEIAKGVQYHQQGRQKRSDSICENFLRIIRYAIDVEADLFIHSGDLFNKYYIPRGILDELILPIENLAKVGIPVLIIPGNHERSEFPFDLLKEVGEKGWFKSPIPKEYGGTDTGATGCCITTEELSRICFALAASYITTLIGGTEQILKFGNPEQKRRWLPKIAKGQFLGAICISEPVVGSDAASMETIAKREGNEYVINGKKNFIINAGTADMYCLYAKQATVRKTESDTATSAPSS